MKLLYQFLSTDKIAIGIESNDKRSLEEQFYSFWNRGATNGELIWMNDGFGNKFFAYFWTNVENLDKYLKNVSFYIASLKFGAKYKGQAGGIKNEAEIIKQSIKKSFIIEDFLPKTISISDYYKYHNSSSS